MKHIVIAVRDSAVNCFNRPMFVPAVGAGIRAFQDEINRRADDNMMSKHPEDFELYELGSFEDGTGELEMLKEVRCLSRGKDCVTQGE